MNEKLEALQKRHDAAWELMKENARMVCNTRYIPFESRRELVERVVAEGAERDRAIEHDRDSQTYVEITQVLDPESYVLWKPLLGNWFEDLDDPE